MKKDNQELEKMAFRYLENGGDPFIIVLIDMLRDDLSTVVLETRNGNYYYAHNGHFYFSDKSKIKDILLFAYLFYRIKLHLERKEKYIINGREMLSNMITPK